MSTNKYTHRIPSYEKSYIDNEKTRTIKHISREVKQKPNTIYRNPITFYDSPVHNSHLYPNMGLIKPVNYEYVPANPSVYIDRTIKENQRFVLGPHIIENRKLVRWA